MIFARYRLPILIVLGVLAALVASPATAESQLKIGFEGKYKAGHWTPIQLAVDEASTDAQVKVVVPDGDGVMCEFPLEVTPTGEFAGYIRIGQSRPTLQVVQDEQTSELALPQESIVRGTQRLVLTIGADVGMEKALQLLNFASETAVQTATVPIADLPDSPTGYDGVDLVIVSTGGDEWANPSPSENQSRWAALEQWVRMGGRLILSVGKHGEQVLADGQPLAKLLPGTFRSVGRQRDTTELETFTSSTKRLDLAWAGQPRAEQGVLMTRIDDARGFVVAADGTGQSAAPWAIRTAFGFGSVTFVTCDLDISPISEWESRPRLVSELLEASLMHRSYNDEGQSRGKLSHLGFNDLSGQLRAAMEQFDGVRLIPFSLIAALAIGYVVFVGPIDFILLRKIAPRMEWTWLTFPLMVIGMTALAVGLSRSWKGATPSRNVVDLLDVDCDSGQLRCTSWAHSYYPTSGQYDFSIQPANSLGKAEGSTISWQGLPGTAFGGMQNRATPLSTSMLEPYSGTLDGIEGLPIPKWSSRSLVATWWRTGQPGASELVVDREELLSGSITNPLPLQIKDAVICYGRSYYEIGTFDPDATFQVGELAQPRDFRYRLTRRRIADDRELIETWNKENVNVPRIMEMMMFHHKAGGRSYTDLWSRYHHQLDFSDHLETGTAVVYGRVSKPATVWNSQAVSEGEEADNEAAEVDTRNWTFCRLLFPVQMNTRSRFRPEEKNQP